MCGPFFHKRFQPLTNRHLQDMPSSLLKIYHPHVIKLAGQLGSMYVLPSLCLAAH